MPGVKLKYPRARMWHRLSASLSQPSVRATALINIHRNALVMINGIRNQLTANA